MQVGSLALDREGQQLRDIDSHLFSQRPEQP
jgi:hypothetical protein